MNRQLIVEGYLSDLGIKGFDLTSSEGQVEFLNKLQAAHIARHSFNSLAVVIGNELPLDLTSLYEKIVVKRRGGYCFEHNKLIFNVLEQLGFDVKLALARVVYNRDVDSPRTHRVTLVRINGVDYVVDGGFGHLGARLPVRLEHGVEQPQGKESFRIVIKESGEHCYQVLKDGDYFTLYTFDLGVYTESDCLVGHFFSHRHPTAAFVNNLVVSRKPEDSIYSLRNGEFHWIIADGTTVTRLTTALELHEKLTQVFELDVDVAISEFLFNKFVQDNS
ncbi:MAG: arylamine N-acetyltransferase [Cellvibrionaceae bacterium]|nr:arylamine N-acetyltransferase [Cellvibrionaceae bacterium]|tara:strand:+ start:27405 stop:28232 length:828 start_codon:yes stop_codon:yes gene_type:complete